MRVGSVIGGGRMLKSQRYHDSIILVVDDEPSALEFLSVLLREAGFEQVLMACSVAEATRRLDSARPDLVLLDWH
ncbi:response regulator [Synechococcus sp. R55.2]|uniref:response regulator n=1 Tax=Synechococcus sp. R55.2 TaxID=2964496 RepID=UPI0039C486F5